MEVFDLWQAGAELERDLRLLAANAETLEEGDFYLRWIADLDAYLESAAPTMH